MSANGDCVDIGRNQVGEITSALRSPILRKNLALASLGTKLKTDESMTKKGNEVWKANDGQVGTMAWRTQANAFS